MDQLTAIISRISPGKLAAPAPSPAEVDRLIEAAVAAPDHGRLRPWKFIVFEGQALDRLGELMVASLKRRVPDADAFSTDREAKKVTRAPMIILVACLARDTAKIPRVEQLLSAGAAAQNILLAAQAIGYAGKWRTGDFIYDPETRRALGLGEADDIVGLLYVGTPVAPGMEREVDFHDFMQRWPGS